MRAVIVIVGILAVGGGWLGYNKVVGGQGGQEYILQTLDRGDIVRTISATGTIEPLIKVVVGSQVSGNIKAWHADFNDRVTAGFVLAEIEQDRFQATHEQARADLAIAMARRDELRVRAGYADHERARIQSLHERKLASDNEILIAQTEADVAIAALRGADASIQAAEARLNAAKVDLEHTIIRSPIDGIVIARNFDVGQTVAASFQAPELFLIANDLARMQVNANVSESDIGLITEDMPAAFRVDAYPARTFEGLVSQIRYDANVVDGVVTYVTLIEVRNDDLALRPGMTANVTFEVAKAEAVLRIPNAALRFSPVPPGAMSRRPKKQGRARTPTVYVLSGGEPKSCSVSIGLSDGRFTELVDGDLTEGTPVVIERNYQSSGGRRRDVTRSLRRGR